MQKKHKSFCITSCFTRIVAALALRHNRQGLKEMIRTLFQMAPDMTIAIEEMVFENNVLCFRNVLRGIGTKDEMMRMVMVKFKDGKVAERWSFNEAQ